MISVSLLRPTVIATVIAAGIAGSAALAHHSYASFDMGKAASVSGTVSRWEWTNPHSFMVVTAAGPDKQFHDYELEAQSPAMLARAGFTRGGIKVGDKVTVTFHPHYTRAYAGSLMEVAYADGRKFGAATRRAPGGQ